MHAQTEKGGTADNGIISVTEELERTLIAKSFYYQMHLDEEPTSGAIAAGLGSHFGWSALQANSAAVISLHSTKCALIHLFGKELQTRAISKLLRDHLNWSGGGVAFDDYRALVSFLKKGEYCWEIVSTQKLYKVFDQFDRGVVSKHNFAAVVMDIVPGFNRSEIDRLFDIIDVYNIGQLTRSQLLEIFSLR